MNCKQIATHSKVNAEMNNEKKVLNIQFKKIELEKKNIYLTTWQKKLIR